MRNAKKYLCICMDKETHEISEKVVFARKDKYGDSRVLEETIYELMGSSECWWGTCPITEEQSIDDARNAAAEHFAYVVERQAAEIARLRSKRGFPSVIEMAVKQAIRAS